MGKRDEVAALEAVFPGVTVYLCDFHREQAWERWTNERKNGLTDEGRYQLLHLLCECANPLSHMPHNILLRQNTDKSSLEKP